MDDLIKTLRGMPWPDMRWWVAFGTFGVVMTMMLMIRENPSLLGVAPFAQLSGGVIALAATVVQHLFGGVKPSSPAPKTKETP